MRTYQQELILGLVRGFDRDPISAEEFLRRFPARDGRELGISLLREAIAHRDASDVSLAMIVVFNFGVSDEHLEHLRELCSADWHESHEDIVDALEEHGGEATVEWLYHLTRWTPPYVEEWESEDIPIKAIWALSKIGGRTARSALLRVAEETNSDELRALAVRRLEATTR